MASKVARILRNPGKYARMLPKKAQMTLAGAFARTAFYLQGQMDISPRSLWHDPDFAASTGGFLPPGSTLERQIFDGDPWDSTRRDMLILLLRSILTRNVDGELAELGVYKGVTARLIHGYVPERRLHLFDTFGGFATADIQQDQKNAAAFSGAEFGDTSLEAVLNRVGRDANVVPHVGRFPDTVSPELADLHFAFVHLDADLYAPIVAGLEFFYPRMSPGGIIVVHDYNAWVGARAAVDHFFADKSEIPLPMPDKSGSVAIVKQR